MADKSGTVNISGSMTDRVEISTANTRFMTTASSMKMRLEPVTAKRVAWRFRLSVGVAIACRHFDRARHGQKHRICRRNFNANCHSYGDRKISALVTISLFPFVRKTQTRIGCSLSKAGGTMTWHSLIGPAPACAGGVIGDSAVKKLTFMEFASPQFSASLTVGRLREAIVAATVRAMIVPTGCGVDRGNDRPVYALCKYAATALADRFYGYTVRRSQYDRPS